MAYLQLPNGSYLEIPEGMSPSEAYQKAQSKFPKAFETASDKPAKRGLGAALGKGTESFLGSVGTAGKALFGDENLAAQEAMAREEALNKKYADQVSLDKLKEVYEKQGLLAAGKELAGQVPLAIAEQAPNIAATLASAKLGAMGGTAVMPGVGTVVGGVLGAAAPSLLSMAGSNIERQAAEQTKANQPIDISTGKAFATAVPQAALDVAATFVPLGGKLAGKVFGPQVEKLLMSGGAEAAEKLAKESFLKTASMGLTKGALAEIPTEVLQQVLERAQAGLDLTSPDALKEYGETAYQVGLLAPIGGAGRFVDKSAAKTQVAEAEDARNAEIARQQKEARDLEKLQEKQAKDVEDLIAAQQATIGVQQTGDIFGEAPKASALEVPQRVSLRDEEAAKPTESPAAQALEENRLLNVQLAELETRRDAAAENGDTTSFAALVKQTAKLQEALDANAEALKNIPGITFIGKKPVEVTPDIEMAQYRGELKKLTGQLSKQVGPAYDAKVSATLAQKIEDTQAKINKLAPAASQFELFDEAQLGAEKRRAERGEREARAQEQADLFAAQKQPTLVKSDEYLKGLQDLEEAYAEGKSERIVDELVAKLQQLGQEKEAGKVGIKGGAAQEAAITRANRIKRAITEEQAKLESAKTNEEVATIRADIAALTDRLGIALTESATAQPENLRAKAEADARDAVDAFSYAINDIRSGSYLNGRDITSAASFRSGLEKQAYEAASAYIDASIRDVNAQRAQARQTALSTDEALKLTNDLSSFFKKSVDSKQPNVRKSLDQIKNKYTKGAPLRKAGPFQLRQEFAPKKLEPETVTRDEEYEKRYGKPSEGGVSPDQKDLFAAKELEPVAITRSTPQNFMKFLGSLEVRKAKEKLKALAVKVKKAEELSKKTPRVDADLIKQVEEQRRLVLEIQNADKIIADLRKKATTIWKEAAGDPTRLKTIDDLHAQANALAKAAKDLPFEKAVLASMERRLAKVPKASPAALKLEKDLARARSKAGELEAIQQKMLEDQVKAKRLAEQAALEETQGLPKTRQEIVETNRALPGADEKLKAKRLTKVEAAKTLEEKRAKVVETEKELAEERKAFREQTSKGMTPQQLEKDIKEFEALAKASRKKGNEAAAKRQEKTAEKLKKDLKSRMDVARMTMRGQAEKKTARPPAMKTGVKPETRGRKAKVDFEEDALDHGVKFDDYEFVRQGLAFGFKAREEAAHGGEGVSQKAAQAEVDKVKLPKGLKVVVLNKLSGNLRDAVIAQGRSPETVRGGVMPNGGVFIVAENHADIKDLKKTIAHELVGHLGVEGLLGEAGMNALVKKVTSQYGSVWKLADELGVTDDVLGAYTAAKRIGKTEEQALGSAVREMIAHTEEARIDKGTLAKINDFIKAIVGAVRAALRKIGVDLDIGTSDIFKLLRDARKDFNEGSPGAYVNKDGDIMFSDKPAVANKGFEYVVSATDKVLAKQKPWKDIIKGGLSGLVFKTKYVDRFAPVEALTKGMEDPLKASQLMYFLRMHDQRMAFTSQVASYGPNVLKEKTRADGKREFLVESEEGASLAKIAKTLKDADVGNPEATNRVFTMYLLAKRAKRVGLSKLNYGGQVTEEMLANTVQAVEANDKTKAAFETAAGMYNEYNKGLVNFAVQTGAISKETAKNMLATEDYVPFYRQNKDGSVLLEIGGAPAIKIGNIKDQPYLHELVGGDQPILDFFTSSLQNTAMLTDMALRNLATRNVAFTLGEMGLLKVGEKEKGIGIHVVKGDDQGPAGPDIIRFKLDGQNAWAVVQSEAAGIPTDLLIRGLEGVNTALPTAVKMMNVPANLLRKWVTRNPAYALRQIVRDPLNAVMVSGANTTPVVSSFKEIVKMIKGKSEGEPLLQRRGILGGQVLTGTSEDMKKILNDITSGKKGWNYRLAQLDQLAIQGDASTRVVMYNSFIKQGLSEMEATLATLEAMNFSKRGISASLFQLSAMVPFMNAQIQGLNVLYNAFTGNMPFNEKLKVKKKLIQRGLMMMGFTLLYAAMMQDDEAYQNANDDEKYGNWFVYTPFSDEPVKVPIPFELGFLFKAVPEGVANAMFGDEKGRDVGAALFKMAFNSIPISGPQGIKPALEVAINHSFFTGREIESKRLQQYEPGERYTERTSEIAKMIGGALNISPTKIEYLVRGYTGSLPLAAASMANPILRSGETGEQPESRGLLSSETPLIGTFFQAKDAQGLVNKAYKDMDEVNEAKATYKKMVAEGREAEAEAYLEANADMIAMGSFAGKFRKKMGDLTNAERVIRGDAGMSAQEKREAIDEIRQMKIQLAKQLSSARG